MISTRKYAGLSVDGAQVSPHSRPPESVSPHGSDSSGWRQGKGSVYTARGTDRAAVRLCKEAQSL